MCTMRAMSTLETQAGYIFLIEVGQRRPVDGRDDR